MTRSAATRRPLPSHTRRGDFDERPGKPGRRWRRPRLPFPPIVGGFVLAAAALTASLAWLLAYRLNFGAVVAYAVAVNATTFFVYAYDKSVAVSGTALWRVPEVALHVLALAGGSPAALAGQQVLRHKTRKGGFRAWFWLIVTLQVLALAAWLYLLH